MAYTWEPTLGCTDETKTSSISLLCTPESDLDCNPFFSTEYLAVLGDSDLASFSPPTAFNLDNFLNSDSYLEDDEFPSSASSPEARFYSLDTPCVSPIDFSEDWGTKLYSPTGSKQSQHKLNSRDVPQETTSVSYQQRYAFLSSDHGFTTPVDSPKTIASPSSNSSNTTDDDEVSRGFAPKLRTTHVRKRSAASKSSSTAAVKSPVADTPRKATSSHTETEKKYRNRLNSQFQRLLASVSNPEDENSEGSTGSSTRKGEVLERARLRIQSLEKENARLGREVNLLVKEMMKIRVMKQNLTI